VKLRVLALDPGVTTGWCLATVWENPDSLNQWVSLRFGESKWSLIELKEVLDEYLWIAPLADDCPRIVLYEDFEYRNNPRPGLNLTPVKMIGVIELTQQMNPTRGEWFKQNAASGKAHFTDQKLKDMGIYVKGKQHGRDAMRHAMQFLTFGAGSQYVDTYAATLSAERVESWGEW